MRCEQSCLPTGLGVHAVSTDWAAIAVTSVPYRTAPLAVFSPLYISHWPVSYHNMTQSSPEDGAPPVPSMLDLMDDTLPSYDTATSAPNYTTDQNGAGSSRAAPPSAPATALSRQAAHLFSGPLNAENLSMPIRHDIEHIHVTDRTFTDGRLSRLIKSESFDERLGERESQVVWV